MSKQLVSQVDIDATAEQVWKVLTDFAAYPAWNPFIVSAVGAAEVGSTVTLRMQPIDARAVTLKPTVLEATPGYRLRWRGRLESPASSTPSTSSRSRLVTAVKSPSARRRSSQGCWFRSWPVPSTGTHSRRS